MATPSVPVEHELRELRKVLKKRLAPLEKARRALDALCASGALRELSVLSEHVPRLKAADLSVLGLAAEHAAVTAELETVRQRLTGVARSELLGALRSAAKAEGLTLVLASERPLTVTLAPLEAVLDVGAGTAAILYAREVVVECEADAAAVLAGRRDAMQAMRDAAVASEVFFERLHRAYRMVLAARGIPTGERVDLVDLLSPLSLLAQGVGAWRRGGLAKAVQMPRHMLAYQLSRLRRDGMMTRDGWRLELGVATGGSAQDKRGVLYLPTSPSDGQYHLSIRFNSGVE